MDIVARIIGDGLSKKLGQSVVVENRGGAGGVIAARSVSQAKPDGYTLLVGVESSNTRGVALNKSLPYDATKDFSYIGKIAKQRNLLVVNPELPVSNVKELIANAQANPSKLNYGGTYGATSHIGGIQFDLLNNTKMTFISYQGGAQPISDLMGGMVQVGFFTEATIAEQVKSGKLKALAITGPERSAAFPDVPTLKEAGAKPMELAPWFGIVGPPGMPQPVVEKLESAINQLTHNKEFVEKLESIGAVPIMDSDSKSFTQDVAKEIAYWKKFVSDTNIPVNK
jgi:tripartite-type tricarboxylate transporter receptor subunit TctC